VSLLQGLEIIAETRDKTETQAIKTMAPNTNTKSKAEASKKCLEVFSRQGTALRLNITVSCKAISQTILRPSVPKGHPERERGERERERESDGDDDDVIISSPDAWSNELFDPKCYLNNEMASKECSNRSYSYTMTVLR